MPQHYLRARAIATRISRRLGAHHARHRPAILAFYRFVRTADDVADHATASPDESCAAGRHAPEPDGASEASPEGAALHRLLMERGLTTDHAADLLEAFRRDVTKLRYADWSELMDYCRYSAMPVGASCSTCTARIAPSGRCPTRCAPRFR